MTGKKWFLAVSVAAVVLVSITSVALMPAVSFHNKLFSYSIEIHPATKGLTRLSLPPAGSVEAKTHLAPVAFNVRLDEINVQSAEKMAKGFDETSLINQTKDAVITSFKRVIVFSLIWVAITASVLSVLALRKWKTALVTALIATIVWSSILGIGIATYNQEAFNEPVYQGALIYAPRVIGMLKTRAGAIGYAAQTLSQIYFQPQISRLGGDLRDTYPVLVVSDLHLNPNGAILMKDLAKEFKVKLIINTGDVNTLGTTFEAKAAAALLEGAPVPQLVVPGNHDSPEVVDALKQVRGVRVLEGQTIKFGGLTIYGLEDPASHTYNYHGDDAATLRCEEKSAEKLRASLRSGETTPDIIATHSPIGETAFAGLGQIVLTGHTHRMLFEKKDTTWYLNSGTLGGVKFAPGPLPCDAVVMYFTSSLPRRLIAVDLINAGEGEASLSRKVVDANLLPAETTTTALSR